MNIDFNSKLYKNLISNFKKKPNIQLKSDCHTNFFKEQEYLKSIINQKSIIDECNHIKKNIILKKIYI